MGVISIMGGRFESNVHAVTKDGFHCVLIDCSGKNLADVCARHGLKVEAVLLTHGHFDHIAGCAEILKHTDAKIYCGEGEDEFIFSEENRSIFGVNIPKFEIYKTLKDGEELDLCGMRIKVISTPGHTPHGVSYLIDGNLFTGDTLFKGSIGRSDFPGGDYDELVNSVKKLYALDGNYTVYSGHGLETTLDYERKNNAFVRA
ncbi:MAG: MBL fold metallo-hydrolase [Clostridia bacterium]|nr:MBL fold metallo-hydrolase [Clostridia bacterium]